MSFRVTRYHDISCGHRVHGHESKCAFLHGHNYRIHFECMASEDSVAALDKIGRVIDFSVIKSRICEWLEKNWDHKFLAWKLDPVMMELYYGKDGKQPHSLIQQSIVWVPFNPTAENMAKYLVENVGRITLEGTGAQLVKVTIDETRKCSASYEPVFYAKDVRADNVYSND